MIAWMFDYSTTWIFSVWSFDMEKENWSLIEAKGEIPVITFKFPNDSNQSFLHIDIVVKKHEYVLDYFYMYSTF